MAGRDPDYLLYEKNSCHFGLDQGPIFIWKYKDWTLDKGYQPDAVWFKYPPKRLEMDESFSV
jgi:hypothetical protein